MQTIKKHVSLTLILIAAVGSLTACSGGKDADKGPQLSTTLSTKIVNGDTVIILDPMAISQEVATLKASDLMEDLQIIQLENSDEALVGEGRSWVFNDRIFIYSDGVVKQFDRKGKYLGKVGQKGQGPGEYTIAPYDFYHDEKSGNTYMAQYNTRSISSYDADGNYLEDITLAQGFPKGTIHVDPENRTVTVSALNFDSDPDALRVWVQDFEGNVIKGLKRPDLAAVTDFSNEIASSVGSGPSDFLTSVFYIDGRPDTLFRYSAEALHPALTIETDGKALPHAYAYNPVLYGVTLFGKPEMVDENSWIIPGGTPIVIRKDNLSAGFASLLLDNLGSVVLKSGWVGGPSYPYFVMNLDPASLADMIEEAPDSHEMVSVEKIAEMKEFGKNIDADGNNYVIIGRWKTKFD